MNATNLFKQACRLYPYGLVSRKTTQINRANWIRSIKYLGNNWILCKKVYHRNGGSAPCSM